MTMPTLDKKSLSERDICSNFITPALVSAKWDLMNQIREEVSFTKGRVIVRGQLSTRGEPKRADYLLSFKPGIPLAVLEATPPNSWPNTKKPRLPSPKSAKGSAVNSNPRLPAEVHEIPATR